MSGAPLENITIEAILPFGVAAMIECQTESKARVLQDVRYTVGKAGGTITPTAFMFEKIGRISFEKQDGLGVDEVLEDAIEAGALDITEEEDMIVIDTPPSEVTAVAQRLQETLKIHMQRSEIVYVPKEDSLVTLDQEQAASLQPILDSIEEESSLQNLYINAVLP